MSVRDAVDLSDGTELHADVCVVGGGPAGIAIALALRTTPLSVVLLESGGTTEDEADRDLNTGANIGLPYYDLDETRHRSLGGGSQRWAGWCRRMDRSDFAPRPWIGVPGWPISFDALAPYYDEAAALCELPEDESPSSYDALPAMYRPPFVGGDVGVATWEGSPPTKFGDVYRSALEESASTVTYLHATVTKVLTNDEGTSATGVGFVNRAGHQMTVRASTVVLCAGAIETTRLLLASRDVHGDGLGNQYDLVGRSFMEHPHLVTARLHLLPPAVTGRAFIPALDRGVGGVTDRLSMQRPSGTRKVAYVIDPERRAAEQALNFSTHLRTVSKVDRESSQTYQAFKLVVGNLRSPQQVASQLRSRRLPEGTTTQVRRLLSGAPELAQVIWEEALKRPDELALYTQCEQAPNPMSRVTIDPRSLDASGLPRVKIDWRLADIDKASVARLHEILGGQFLRSGLGVLVPEPPFLEEGDDWGPHLRGGHHHMGTARMAVSPRDGVVDTDCRVHGVAGLYVGDSSVFPVGGYANPLLTTVAVARRLGSHLAGSSA